MAVDPSRSVRHHAHGHRDRVPLPSLASAAPAADRGRSNHTVAHRAARHARARGVGNDRDGVARLFLTPAASVHARLKRRRAPHRVCVHRWGRHVRTGTRSAIRLKPARRALHLRRSLNARPHCRSNNRVRGVSLSLASVSVLIETNLTFDRVGPRCAARRDDHRKGKRYLLHDSPLHVADDCATVALRVWKPVRTLRRTSRPHTRPFAFGGPTGSLTARRPCSAESPVFQPVVAAAYVWKRGRWRL